jgi:hypothetical protein
LKTGLPGTDVAKPATLSTNLKKAQKKTKKAQKGRTLLFFFVPFWFSFVPF